MEGIDSSVQPSTPPQKSRAGRLTLKPHIIVLWITAVIAAIIAATLVVRATRPPEMHGTLFQPPFEAADFTLESSSGAPLSLSDLRGKFVALYFGYTYCPDVCPTTLNDLAVMLDTLGSRKAENVQVVMISVDPQRDTAEHLADYLQYFDPSFVGLTGTLDEIQSVASQYGVFFEAHPGTVESGYLVDHTAIVTVIDSEGKVRLIFPYGTAGADMAADLAYLMR